MLFEPVELLERLAALVPPPRFNLVRYHGVLGPAAKHRAAVVSRADGRPSTSDRSHSGCIGSDAERTPSSPPTSAADPTRAIERPQSEASPLDGTATERSASPDAAGLRRYEWAELMRRVFSVDVFECPRCAGRMRILSAIHPPTATRAILECLDMPTRPPPVAPPPKAESFVEEFDFGA
jgi:hypothetical protein